ncbi:MAG: hypothetical protein ACI4PX_07845 [Ruminococcus sp.]
MKNFILSHKRLSVGIILYIAVFIVSGFISPWQIRDINLSDLDIDDSAGVMDKVPLKIIYFGIYELIELLVYADSDVFSANGIMFFISVCALFSYTYVIRKSFIKNELDSKAEEIAIDFIYDNIFAYISSLIAYYFYKSVEVKIAEIMGGGKTWLICLTVFIIICFVIIPAFPQLLQLLAYVFLVSMTAKLLVTMDSLIEWNIIIKKIIIFLVGAVLIVLINLVINVLLERMQSAVAEFLVKFFPAMGLMIAGIVRICVKIIIAVIIISAVLAVVFLIVDKLAYA